MYNLVKLLYKSLIDKKISYSYGGIENVLKSEIYKLIISKNYTLVNWLHSDLVFVHKDFKD